MPDAAIPIFQTVNQSGEATLEVEAFIKALGLILEETLAEFSGETGSVDVINWINKAQDRISQQIRGWHSADPTKIHTMELLGIGQITKAALQITGGGVGNNYRVEALGGLLAGFNNGLRILESTEKAPFLPLSDFVIGGGGHVGESKHMVLTSGLINAAGAIISKIGFFSCAHTAVGTYEITLGESENFQTHVAMTGSDAQNTGRLFSYFNSGLNPVKFVIVMRNPASFAPEDIAFSFNLFTSN